jgi:hypothetical protein
MRAGMPLGGERSSDEHPLNPRAEKALPYDLPRVMAGAKELK